MIKIFAVKDKKVKCLISLNNEPHHSIILLDSDFKVYKIGIENDAILDVEDFEEEEIKTFQKAIDQYLGK